ncbi:hypothetical protein pneo_cds_980 [Pandoravirus neocaledonia]|uniref:F-box incomplete domain containing protein n=1 Tax=Pandoravirus neocaledonia TaxID=2107708 RepID=A0A2U7UDS7_9VIRU|nr:hypothetical protein pneo_cds_980 [Pandoravirus neocaledonia]AVK76587.1 hypothetical protein pneo_cds_980 [Pandoravirus neocaledonia]
MALVCQPPSPATIDDLPSELVWAILAHLGWRWRFCARPARRLWRTLCDAVRDESPHVLDDIHKALGLYSANKWAVEEVGRALRGIYVPASSMVERVCMRKETDPLAVLALCLGVPETSEIDAAAVMIAAGHADLVRYVVSRRFTADTVCRRRDLWSDRPPMHRLTDLVVGRCSAASIDQYLDANPHVPVRIVPALRSNNMPTALSCLLGKHQKRFVHSTSAWKNIGAYATPPLLVTLLDRIDAIKSGARAPSDDPVHILVTVDNGDWLYKCAMGATRNARIDILDILYAHNQICHEDADVCGLLDCTQSGGPIALQ